MNEINSFTFYKNYFELIDNLDKKNKLIMLEAIVDYVFKDIEPNLDGMNKAIWSNIVLPINKSKNNSVRGSKGGAPTGNDNAKKTSEKTNQKQTKNKRKNKPNDVKKQANNISTFLFIISNFIKDRGLLRGKIEDWMNYKEERNEIYTQTGLKSLLTQIENNVNKYGEENVIELIDNCMASNYKGIVFDKLKQQRTQKNNVPNWNENEIKSNEATIEEQEKMNKMLEEFK
jgi:hypothetical protein